MQRASLLCLVSLAAREASVSGAAIGFTPYSSSVSTSSASAQSSSTQIVNGQVVNHSSDFSASGASAFSDSNGNNHASSWSTNSGNPSDVKKPCDKSKPPVDSSYVPSVTSGGDLAGPVAGGGYTPKNTTVVPDYPTDTKDAGVPTSSYPSSEPDVKGADYPLSDSTPASYTSSNEAYSVGSGTATSDQKKPCNKNKKPVDSGYVPPVASGDDVVTSVPGGGYTPDNTTVVPDYPTDTKGAGGPTPGYPSSEPDDKSVDYPDTHSTPEYTDSNGAYPVSSGNTTDQKKPCDKNKKPVDSSYVPPVTSGDDVVTSVPGEGYTPDNTTVVPDYPTDTKGAGAAPTPIYPSTGTDDKSADCQCTNSKLKTPGSTAASSPPVVTSGDDSQYPQADNNYPSSGPLPVEGTTGPVSSNCTKNQTAEPVYPTTTSPISPPVDKTPDCDTCGPKQTNQVPYPTRGAPVSPSYTDTPSGSKGNGAPTDSPYLSDLPPVTSGDCSPVSGGSACTKNKNKVDQYPSGNTSPGSPGDNDTYAPNADPPQVTSGSDSPIYPGGNPSGSPSMNKSYPGPQSDNTPVYPEVNSPGGNGKPCDKNKTTSVTSNSPTDTWTGKNSSGNPYGPDTGLPGVSSGKGDDNSVYPSGWPSASPSPKNPSQTSYGPGSGMPSVSSGSNAGGNDSYPSSSTGNAGSSPPVSSGNTTPSGNQPGDCTSDNSGECAPSKTQGSSPSSTPAGTTNSSGDNHFKMIDNPVSFPTSLRKAPVPLD